MDIERTMQFILEQQAQISAQFAAHQVQIAEQFAASKTRFDSEMLRINAVLLNVAIIQERADALLVTLAERQIATEEAMGRLAERQSITEQSLNSLLSTVERHLVDHK